MSDWTEADLKRLRALLKKFGPEEVAKKAHEGVPPKQGGRRADPRQNLWNVWACVELWQRHAGHDIDAACNEIASDLKKETTNRQLSAERVRGLYYEARDALEQNDKLKTLLEMHVVHILGKAGASFRPIPNLWRLDPNNDHVSMIVKDPDKPGHFLRMIAQRRKKSL